MKTNFSKYIFIGFLALGIFNLIRKDIGQALMSFGIALAFDPFNTEQKWNERPDWQKLVLITHLSVVFGLVFIELFNLIKR